jgi:hypothetical protein
MPRMELTDRMWREVLASRQAMRAHLEKAYPEDAGRLLAVAIAGAFCDLITGSPIAGQRALLSIVNGQLGEAGLRITPLLRN